MVATGDQIVLQSLFSLLSIKDEQELLYYVNIAFERNLSKRELREKIKNKEYERLPIETKNKLILITSYQDMPEIKILISIN